MSILNLTQVGVDDLMGLGRPGSGPPPPDDGDKGGIRGLLIKAAGLVLFAVITWMGTQLSAVPRIEFKTNDVERRVVELEQWKKQEEKRHQEEAESRARLIQLLESDLKQRRRR